MFYSPFDLDGRSFGMSFPDFTEKEQHIIELDRLLRTGHGNYNPADPQSECRSLKAVSEIEGHLFKIREYDPAYYVAEETAELIRGNYLQDATYHESCFATYLHKSYQRIANTYGFPLMVCRDYERTVAQAFRSSLERDIAGKPVQYLHGYVINTQEACRRLGISFDKKEASRWIYNRVEKEIETLDPIETRAVIGCMEESLHRLGLKPDAEQRNDIYRIVVTGGIDAINRSFTEAALPEAPANGEIVRAITSSLALIGVSHANLSVAQIAVSGAEERAKLREFTQNLRLELGL